MCGIAGLLMSHETDGGLNRRISAMTDALVHRGPDDGNVWISPERGIALGHRRLSIIDVHVRARQPMVSHDQRWVLTYNGEIYNYADLKQQLARLGVSFQTSSDTEVVLACIAQWGIYKTLSLIEGMFAFAVWDRHEHKLYACRDRAGIKPFYWAFQNGVFAFGSELKTIFKSRAIDLQIREEAVFHLLDFGYIPSPLSIFKDVWKLSPGHMLVVSQGKAPEIECYWSCQAERIKNIGKIDARSDEEIISELDGLLTSEIEQYIIADVPLGSFLSGGIDSSLVTAIAARRVGPDFQTFTLGYCEEAWDESNHAREVALALGTKHSELILKDQDIEGLIKEIPAHYDEPFADFSQLPSMAIARFAHKKVRVCLSGDGGDELFAGYTRYDWFYRFWKLMKRLNPQQREALLLTASLAQPCQKDSSSAQIGREIERFLPVLAAERDNPKLFYRRILSFGPSPLYRSENSYEPLVPEWATDEKMDFMAKMQMADFRHYMSDGILTKVDRASMSTGLEVRVPLLAESVVSFAFGLPLRARYRSHQLRYIQRELARRYVPDTLVNHPKMGFGFPIDKWMTTSLKPWMKDLLSESNLARFPYLNKEEIQLVKDVPTHNETRRYMRLWPILMYLQWDQHWRSDFNHSPA